MEVTACLTLDPDLCMNILKMLTRYFTFSCRGLPLLAS